MRKKSIQLCMDLGEKVAGEIVIGRRAVTTRDGAIALIDYGDETRVYASPNWENESTLAMGVDLDGHAIWWDLAVPWSEDLDECAMLWRTLVESNRERIEQTIEELAAEHDRGGCDECGSESLDRDGDCLSCGHAFDEATKLVCPFCGGSVHQCESGDPGCLHCDKCWWNGNPNQARRAS